MSYNLPAGTTFNDIDDTLPEDPHGVCQICGGDLLSRSYPGGYECFDCGTTDPEDVALCTMCGDFRPKVINSERGYQAVCECGVSGPYETNAEAALCSWATLHG